MNDFEFIYFWKIKMRKKKEFGIKKNPRDKKYPMGYPKILEWMEHIAQYGFQWNNQKKEMWSYKNKDYAYNVMVILFKYTLLFIILEKLNQFLVM